MPKAVSMSGECYSSEEALERARYFERQKIGLGVAAAAAETLAAAVAVAGIVVAIDPDA